MLRSALSVQLSGDAASSTYRPTSDPNPTTSDAVARGLMIELAQRLAPRLTVPCPSLPPSAAPMEEAVENGGDDRTAAKRPRKRGHASGAIDPCT